MNVKFLLCAILMCIGHHSYCQQKFVVWDMEGVTRDSASDKPLHKGVALTPKAVLRLDAKAKLLLLCPNYRTMIVEGDREKPSYRHLSRLRCGSTNNWASFYFRNVWEDLLSNHHSNIENHPIHYMSLRGGVTRGYFEDTLSVVAGDINYCPDIANSKGRLRITTLNGDTVVAETLSSRHCFHLSLNDAADAYYRYSICDTVSAACGESGVIHLWRRAEYDLLKTKLENLTLFISNKQEAAFLRGAIWESWYFRIEARQKYEEAIMKR